MPLASHFISPAVAAACLLLAVPAAHASVSDSFDCGGAGISITLTLEPETGMATLVSPRGTEQLSAEGAGTWRDDTQELQFFADEVPPTLWLGPEQFTCHVMRADNEQTHASGAVGGNEMAVNAEGLSLGGRLRNGPGTNFSVAGSLAEGTPVTIVTNTGVRTDGYDWFEIRTGNGTAAYQWGGIMCSQGQLVAGVYEQCRP